MKGKRKAGRPRKPMPELILREHAQTVSKVLSDVVQLVLSMHGAIKSLQESMGKVNQEIENVAEISVQLTERVTELERLYDIDHIDV